MKHFWLCLFLGIPSLAVASPYSDFNAGLAALTRGDEEAAMTALTAALAAPDLLPAFRTTAYFDRSGIYVDRKQWDLAIADLTAALKIDPEYLDAYDRRSEAYQNAKLLDLAIADITTIISRRPSWLTLYLRRAVLLSENNSIDAAIADANTVIGIEPGVASTYQFRGVLYHKKGDIEQALADDEKAVGMDSRISAAYYDRGTIFQEREEFDQAERDFAQVSKMDHTNAAARFRFGVTAWELGKFDDALRSFSDATAPANGGSAAQNALWRWIVAVKAGKSEAFNLPAKQTANKEWPEPLLDLYEGKGSIEAVMKASEDTVPANAKDKTCEANFYGGVWQEIHADKGAASAMLGAAASGCPSNYLERSAASAELKRLQ